MSEPATAELLPVLVQVQGKAYIWTPSEGLDPAVALTLHRFIWKEALRFAATAAKIGLEVEDLVQEGQHGAIIAARRFDPSKGTRYITYAVWWVRARILDALRRPMVHVPAEASRSMCRGEGLPAVSSLDIQILGDGTTIADLLASEEGDQAERRVAAHEVLQFISLLQPRERLILSRRFGLFGRHEETLDAIGASLGLSRERVRQLQDQAIGRLRHHIRKA